MTSLYSHSLILVLFDWIIKQGYKSKYLVSGDWSQSTGGAKRHVILYSVPVLLVSLLSLIFHCFSLLLLRERERRGREERENYFAFRYFVTYALTHLNLASHKRDIRKQCRHGSDAAEFVSDQGLHCCMSFFLYILPFARAGILGRDARQARTDRKLIWNKKSKSKIVKWIKDDRLK